MSTAIRLTFALSIIASALTACTSSAAPTLGPAEIEATVNAVLTADAPSATVVPPATVAPSPEAGPTTSFEAATYRDEVAGFELDYPAGWVVGPIQQYSRGGITAFTSWDRPAEVLPDAAPPGETRMDATVQLWDPVGDLEAFLAQRELAWEASGIEILSEERWLLEDGRPAASFIVEATDGEQAFFFFTTIGDRYLVLSGTGDLPLLSEIANTVRPVPVTY